MRLYIMLHTAATITPHWRNWGLGEKLLAMCHECTLKPITVTVILMGGKGATTTR
jgi:hypothetical protein